MTGLIKIITRSINIASRIFYPNCLKMPRGVKLTADIKEEILAAVTATPHASLVARENGWSFVTVWRIAVRAGVELTVGREAKGYWRLAPDRRAKVIAARQANPQATQAEIAGISGVSLSTVRRIEPVPRPRSVRSSFATGL